MKVGIFDSGVGGITVLKEALKQLPELEYIYYTDNLHVPYGTKPKEEVLGYVEEIMAFLASQKVDAVVIACNTATSIAVERLRKQYSFPIIGMEPAVKLALDHTITGKVLVTATPLTLKEEKFKRLVDSFSNKSSVQALPLPELVSYAENSMFDEEKLTAYFKEKLSPFNLDEYNGLVLGCTHFTYFKKFLQHLLPEHIKIYDGNEGTIHHLKEVLEKEKHVVLRGKSDKETDISFYYSGKKDNEKEVLNKYLNLL